MTFDFLSLLFVSRNLFCISDDGGRTYQSCCSLVLRKLRWAVYLSSAWWALRLIRLLLRYLGYRRTVRVLARMSPTPKRQSYSDRMRVVARAIERVDEWWPHQPNGCLRRSLLFWWVFRWRGYDSEIRTGLRRDGDSFELHAWVQCKNMVLNDSWEKVSQYTVLWDELSSRVIEAEYRN